MLVLPKLLFTPEATILGVKVESAVGGVANGLVIPLLNACYRWCVRKWSMMLCCAAAGTCSCLNLASSRVAVQLTENEHHRFESEHVKSLIVKLFAFQFVNSYGSLFYIGFWLRDMEKLGSYLAGILITGQLIRIGKEHILSQLLANVRYRNVRQKDRELIASVVEGGQADDTQSSRDRLRSAARRVARTKTTATGLDVGENR